MPVCWVEKAVGAFTRMGKENSPRRAQAKRKIPMDADGTKAQLRKFLVRSLGNSRLADDDDIFEVGGATSLFAMELVMFIEERFRSPLDDAALERDNFRSISAMASLVDRKRKARKGNGSPEIPPVGR